MCFQNTSEQVQADWENTRLSDPHKPGLCARDSPLSGQYPFTPLKAESGNLSRISSQ